MSNTLPHSAAAHRAASLPAAKYPGGGEPFFNHAEASAKVGSCGVTRQVGGRGPGTVTAQVLAFNLAHPVGTAGFLLRDNGTVTPTVVEEPAIVLAGHIAVARFAGLRGFFSIERFTTGEDQP